MFDCIGAILTYLHGTSFTCCMFWVRKLKKKWRTFPCLDQINLWCWFEHLKKLDWWYDKDNSCRWIVHVQFLLQVSHFTGKTTRILSTSQGLFLSSDWFDLKFRQKMSKNYIINMPRTFLWNNSLLSNFCFVICIWQVNVFEVSLVLSVR